VGGAAGEHQHQFEIAHFEACSSVTQPISVNQIIPGFTDVTWNKCHGPYENAAPPDPKTPETGGAFCYPRGDRHFGQAPPNIVTAWLGQERPADRGGRGQR
jgi:hypothetical protein